MVQKRKAGRYRFNLLFILFLLISPIGQTYPTSAIHEHDIRGLIVSTVIQQFMSRVASNHWINDFPADRSITIPAGLGDLLNTVNSVRIHFIDQQALQQKNPEFSIKIKSGQPAIEVTDTAGIKIISQNRQQIILDLAAITPLSAIRWRSGKSEHFDFFAQSISPLVTPPPQSQIPECETLSFTGISVHRDENATLSVVGEGRSLSEINWQEMRGKRDYPYLSEAVLRQIFMAWLQWFLDIWFGSSDVMIAPEQYRYIQYLSGEKETGFPITTYAFDDHPCPEFRPPGPTAEHYRNALLIWGRSDATGTAQHSTNESGNPSPEPADEDSDSDQESDSDTELQAAIAGAQDTNAAMNTDYPGASEQQSSGMETESSLLSENNDIPTIITKLVDAFIQEYHDHRDEDEDEVDIEDVQCSDYLLYSLTVTAIGYFMEAELMKNLPADSDHTDDTEESEVYKKVNDHLSANGIEDLHKVNKYYDDEVELYMPAGLQGMVFFIPTGTVAGEAEAEPVLHNAVQLLLTELISEFSHSQSEAAGSSTGSTELMGIPPWKKEFYQCSFRLMFDTRNKDVFNNQQRQMLIKKLDQSLSGRLDWRKALILINDEDEVEQSNPPISDHHSATPSPRRISPQPPLPERQPVLRLQNGDSGGVGPIHRGRQVYRAGSPYNQEQRDQTQQNVHPESHSSPKPVRPRYSSDEQVVPEIVLIQTETNIHQQPGSVTQPYTLMWFLQQQAQQTTVIQNSQPAAIPGPSEPEPVNIIPSIPNSEMLPELENIQAADIELEQNIQRVFDEVVEQGREGESAEINWDLVWLFFDSQVRRFLSDPEEVLTRYNDLQRQRARAE